MQTPRPWIGHLVAAVFLVGGLGVGTVVAEEEGPDAPFVRRRAQPFVALGPNRLAWFVDEPAVRARVEQAVERGLAWLVARQEPDGRWGRRTHALWCHGTRVQGATLPPEPPVGEDGIYDTALTGLAVTALLDAGHHPYDEGPHAVAARRGIAFLLARQDAEGCFGERTDQRYIFNQAFAGYAILRAYAATGGADLREAANRSLAFVQLARNPYFAWRYGVKPGDNDTVVTGALALQLGVAQALQRVRLHAGEGPLLDLDVEVFDGMRAWIEKMVDPDYGRTGYIQRGGAPSRYVQLDGRGFPGDRSESTTAIGIYVRTLTKEDPRQSEIIRKGYELLADVPPAWNPGDGSIDLYYWWYGARAAALLDALDGRRIESMDAWRRAAVQALLAGQVRGADPCADHGSWPPNGVWGLAGGRVYSTAVALSTLLLSARRSVTTTDQAAVQSLRNRETDLEDRLVYLEAVRRGASRRLLKTLETLLADPEPAIRIAAAEALARLGRGAVSTRNGIARRLRLGREKAPAVRRALAYCLLAIGKSSKATDALAQLAAEDPDVALRYLLRRMAEAHGKGADAEAAHRLTALGSATEVVALAELSADPELEERARRASSATWRLLRKGRLPHQLGSRVGQRLRLLAPALLESPGVVEAVEAAFAASDEPNGSYAKTRSAHDDAIRAVDRAAREGQRAVEGLPFATALEIHFAEWSRLLRFEPMAQALGMEHAAAVDDVRFRLEACRKALLTSAGDYPWRPAARSCALAAQRWAAVLAADVPQPDAKEVLQAALDDHTSLGSALRVYDGVADWLALDRAELLWARARLTDAQADSRETTEIARGLLATTPTTVAARRAVIRAGMLYLELAPRGEWACRVEDGLEPLPEAPLATGLGPSGVQVELLDVAVQRLPAHVRTDAGLLNCLTPQPYLVVRVRWTTTKPDLTWDPQVLRRCVFCRDAAGERLAEVSEGDVGLRRDALGGTPTNLKRVPPNQSVVTVHLFPVPAKRGAVSFRIGLREGLLFDEADAAIQAEVPEEQIPRRYPWYRGFVRDLAEVEARIPDLGRTREGFDLLVYLGIVQDRVGDDEAAAATLERVKALAEARGEPAWANAAQSLEEITALGPR